MKLRFSRFREKKDTDLKLRCLRFRKKIDTEWGVKYTVSILLLSHPQYPSLSSKGMQMQWQTGAKVMTHTIVPLLADEKEKEFHKDYKELTWELHCFEDGSIWLTNA